MRRLDKTGAIRLPLVLSEAGRQRLSSFRRLTSYTSN